MNKIEVQQTAEHYTLDKLLGQGHHIIGQNVRRRHYEFDLVSSFGNITYIHEVRGTENQTPVPLQFFPKMKLLTLINGTRIYFPNSEIRLYLVSLRADQPTRMRKYRIEDFL